MSEYMILGLVGLTILLTHFQEAITGFGCTVLALPFVAMLLGLKTAVPVLVIHAWLLALFIVIASRKQIVWHEYGRIVGLAAVGLPVGMYMARALPETGLKWLLAFFMVGVGIQGLARLIVKGTAESKMSPRKRMLLSTFLPMGGLIQGAFGSGGPFVVIYASRALQEKSLFRVTLCLVWLTLNGALIAQWLVLKTLTPHVLNITLICLPFTVIGMFLGNIAHHKVDEMLFRRIVYTVLIGSGVVLFWSLLK